MKILLRMSVVLRDACVRSRASPFIVSRRDLRYKYRRQSRGR